MIYKRPRGSVSLPLFFLVVGIVATVGIWYALIARAPMLSATVDQGVERLVVRTLTADEMELCAKPWLVRECARALERGRLLKGAQIQQRLIFTVVPIVAGGMLFAIIFYVNVMDQGGAGYRNGTARPLSQDPDVFPRLMKEA